MFRRLLMPECLRFTPVSAIADVRVGIMTFFPPCLCQMFEAEEDGSITQLELAVILKTALGVTHLGVSRLFQAIDVVDAGKITFGEWMNRISHLNFRTDVGCWSLSLLWYLKAFSNVFSVSGALLWPFCRKVQKFCGSELRFCWGLPVCRKPKPPQWNLPPSWNEDQLVFPEPARHCHPQTEQRHLPRLQPQRPCGSRRTSQETQLSGVLGWNEGLSWWEVVVPVCVWSSMGCTVVKG